LQEALFPALVKGSRYADRAPIGTPESIKSFKPERLRQFYTDWYRPDLTAVIAVGDFDQAAVAAQIAKQFGTIPASVNPRPRPSIAVPPQPGTAFVISPIAIDVGRRVHRAQETGGRAVTVGDYRRDAIERLMTAMMSARLAVAQTPTVRSSMRRCRVRRPCGRSSCLTRGGRRNNQLEAGLQALAVERASRQIRFTEPS
jgi:zinc protease